MELLDYLTVRRAYNLVRRDCGPDLRLTFPEFAILCRLSNAGGSLKTSEIAEYQGSLRPTMTHRTKHLDTLGLIKRAKGVEDRRNVVCELTEKGERYVEDLCASCCSMIKVGQPLSRIDSGRMSRYVDAMGAVACKAGELVLLGVHVSEDGTSTVTSLVEMLGLLQPTVSMSVASLEEQGLVERTERQSQARTSSVQLTEAGAERARELADEIAKLVVKRRSRVTR